jgi:Tol biopolymer transport system component
VRVLILLPVLFLVAACGSSPAASGTTEPSRTPGPAVSSSPTLQATAAPSVTSSPITTTLANPRGSAVNGPIFFGVDGDVFSLDPATGVRTAIQGGRTKDYAPNLSPDGRKVVTFRADDEWLYVSAPDGSGLKRWATGREISLWTWAPDGSRIAAISDGGTARDLIIWDGGTGAKKHLDIDVPADHPMWVDNDTLLLMDVKDNLAVDYWTVNIDGTGLKAVAALHPCCGASVHHETGELAYSDFVFNVATSSSVHIVDLATGADRILASTAVAGESYVGPRFSPDGKYLVAEQFAPGLPAHRPVLLSADGTGVPLPLGPNPATNQITHVTFSPDSTRLLLTRQDGAYLFSIPDGAGGRVDWPMGQWGAEEESDPEWQRLPG